jgi:hypothetical protein
MPLWDLSPIAVTGLDQREKRLIHTPLTARSSKSVTDLKWAAKEPNKTMVVTAQFLRFEHLIHIGLWSNGFGAPHHGK